MGNKEIMDRIKSSIIELDMNGAVEATREAIEQGIPAPKLINEVRAVSQVVGNRFEKGDYFISELIITGAIMKEITEIITAHIASGEVSSKGTVVIGSAPGDLHDIGKNLAASLLIGAGFRVVDLGIDVSPDRFVEAVEKEDAKIVGISALISTTMLTMGDVVKALTAAGLRDRVKIIFGGAPMTQEFATTFGADAFVVDAMNGVRICEEWAEELRARNVDN